MTTALAPSVVAKNPPQLTEQTGPDFDKDEILSWAEVEARMLREAVLNPLDVPEED